MIKSPQPNIQKAVAPTGALLQLDIGQVKPSVTNPRQLFDRAPLEALKQSIRAHGVLVPITVFKLPGQDRYGIVDGERRFRCCVELHEEGVELRVPANVVSPPDAMASLIYMFNIHSFREQWELMPTAIGLQRIIDHLEGPSDSEIHELTGLSEPQIRRCRIILSFPKKFQELSLDPDPATRIPSNFWIELAPLLDLAPDLIPDLFEELSRDGITEKLVEKYRKKRIKSVIHFRRIVEAVEVTSGDEASRLAVADRLREYVLTPDLETRAAFDEFIVDQRRVQKASDACRKFITDLERASVEYAIEPDDRAELIQQLRQVCDFSISLIERLSASDAPAVDAN